MTSLAPSSEVAASSDRKAKVRERVKGVQAQAQCSKKADAIDLVTRIDYQWNTEQDDRREKTEALQKFMQVQGALEGVQARTTELERAQSKTAERIVKLTKQLEAESAEFKVESAEYKAQSVEYKAQSEEQKTQSAEYKAQLEEQKTQLAELVVWIKEQESRNVALQDENTNLEKSREVVQRERDAVLNLQQQVKWQQSIIDAHSKHFELTDSILLRNLVDQAQAILAKAARLTIDSAANASSAWRTTLDDAGSNDDRLKAAKALFDGRNDVDARDAMKLLESEAMTLVVERHAPQHSPLSSTVLQPQPSHQLPQTRAQYRALADFLYG